MSKIGYIRVSTEHQETARQQEIMCSYQVDRIFSEKLSGANTDRPQLRAMLDYVREGDTLYIESISRLGRSTKDLLNIIDTLTDKGVTLISHKEKIDPTRLRGNLCSPCSLPSHSWSVSSSNRDSVRASKLLRHRASTRDGNLSPPTGRGSGSSMGNGERRTSRAGTLCGEWICRQILSTAVCVSMKSVTVSPSRLLPDDSRQRNGNVPHSRPSLRSVKVTTEKKSSQKRLHSVSESFAVIVCR